MPIRQISGFLDSDWLTDIKHSYWMNIQYDSEPSPVLIGGAVGGAIFILISLIVISYFTIPYIRNGSMSHTV